VATLVAIVGVVVPSALGFLCGVWFLPGESMEVHLFVGAILCATSVGITARVLKDLKKIHTGEARVILGAAVIDDVLGLIVLAVVAGIVEHGRLDALGAVKITALAVGFLIGVVWVGARVVARVIPPASGVFGPHAKLLLPLCVACIVAWMANLIGLAAIVGAFAAGLILHEGLFPNEPTGQVTKTMEDFIQPLEAIFAPIFFVLMGMQVNLEVFLDPGTVALAAAFTVVAVLGKLACGLVCGRKVDGLTVGFGMVPRGEVGLIFAGVGKAMKVVSAEVFSAMVVMVMITTFVTPILLKWSMARRELADSRAAT
jgi:Kef-type K+ transport system membrane component KefB